MQSRRIAGVLIVSWFLQHAAPAETMRLISSPALSPDGKLLVFEWAGDLWTAPSEGGEATRRVTDPARDFRPHFTPDGKRIVFSSDRDGTIQVYSIPAEGGELLQHSHHGEGNELECLSPDGTRALVSGPRERSGPGAVRLMEIDLVADHRERRLFDAAAHDAAWSPDGTRILFCRGGENVHRKGYHGSRASQIWLYQIKDRSFERVVNGDTDARSPMWMPDGREFCYVSSASGTANLHRHLDKGSDIPLTFYQDDGVITPTMSADGGTFVFRRGLDTLRFRPGVDKEPVRIELRTRETLADISTDSRKISGTACADFTPDLRQVVFSAAGDLWWIPAAGKPAVRLTETAAAEDDLDFSPDGAWLYFLRDDGIEANYFRARFSDGRLSDEEAVTRGTRSKSRLKFSRDGSRIAWVEGSGELLTANADGSEVHRVFTGWNKPHFDWSPDGRWIALAADDANSNRDILLADSLGDKEPIHLTRHTAYEGYPKWSPDGRRLVFYATRGKSDLQQLWGIDFGSAPLTPESAARAGTRAKMIPTGGIEPTSVIWSADSKSLLFQSTDKSSKQLHSIGIDGGDPDLVSGQRGTPIRMTADGKLLWLVDRRPAILGESAPSDFTIDLNITRPREEVLTLGFRRIWRTLAEGFHDAELNGRDWNATRLKYEDAARTARSSREFAEVVDMLTGELNSSHLGFLAKPWPADIAKPQKDAITSFSGLVFHDDQADPGAPLRIRRVVIASPASMVANPPVEGERVVRIAGESVSNGTPLHRFFNGANHGSLPVVLRNLHGDERVVELRGMPYQSARLLDRLAGAMKATEAARSAPHPAAWIAVPDMHQDTLADLEQMIYQASLVSDRLVLDLRNNAGGDEADRMLALFCQPVHAFTVPRDGPKGYPLDRRPAPSWDKALVVLCNENTCSNAEIFCHAIQSAKRAPLVGTATPGGVVSAMKVEIPDVGELQLPTRGWFSATTGENLDLHGARPDFPVELTPADEDAGRDPQLEKALEVLEESAKAGS